MSSDERHPADFLYQLASAIKAVRDRGGKWNRTADTIQWASDRIVRLEAERDVLIAAARKLFDPNGPHCCDCGMGSDWEDLKVLVSSELKR